jgi:hypothetical protein
MKKPDLVILSEAKDLLLLYFQPGTTDASLRSA